MVGNDAVAGPCGAHSPRWAPAARCQPFIVKAVFENRSALYSRPRPVVVEPGANMTSETAQCPAPTGACGLASMGCALLHDAV